MKGRLTAMLFRTRHSLLALSLLLIAAMLTAILSPAPAQADVGKADASVGALGRVDLNGSAYAEIKQVHLLPAQNGNTVTFTLSVTNQGSSDLTLIDYGVRLLNQNGEQFSVLVLPQDQSKSLVAAGASQDIGYYASVNQNTGLQDLKFQIYAWDFTLSGFVRTIGELDVPADYSDASAANAEQIVSLGGISVQVGVKRFLMGENDRYHLPKLTLTLQNVDNHTLTAPDDQFSLRIPGGYSYPLDDAQALKSLTLSPFEKKEVTFTGSVPSAVAEDGWQLAITQQLGEMNLQLPIAYFQLPALTKQDDAAGAEKQFTDDSGLYTVKLNGLYRLPWQDQDILNGVLTLSNEDADSLPIPNLAGYFMLDDAVKVEAKAVVPSKVIGIGKGESVSVQISGKVPYTYRFSRIKLVLQEKTSDSETSDVLDFDTPADTLNVPILGAGDTFKTSDPGYRSAYKVAGVKMYGSDFSEMITAALEVTNLEQRFTDPVKLIASFRGSDGNVFPASIAEVADKVMPEGKALLTVFASLPKDYPVDGMSLLVGEAVEDGALASDTAKADSYINPFAFKLPKDDAEPKHDLNGIQLAPYTLSLNHIGTSMDQNGLHLKFDYQLARDTSMLVNADGHKLILNIEDANGVRTLELAYDATSFEIGEGDTSETPQSTLKVGKHTGFIANLGNKDLLYKLSFLKAYRFNVYDEFQGQRRLLASKQIDWLTTTSD